MKYWLILLLQFTNYLFLKAQTADDLTGVDARALHFPAAVTYSTSQMANYIQEHFTGDIEKIRAAYRWVTANIKYDNDSMLPINWSKNKDEKIAATLRRRKGVCDNFASVFTDVLIKMNFSAYTVNGIVKSNRSSDAGGHSWSAVLLKDQWYLCDPTWDAAYTYQTNFFMILPEAFIEKHWPFDPLWQLLPFPISFAEFKKHLTEPAKNKTYFNVADSLKAFAMLDSLQQLEAANRRMKAAGLQQETLQTWLAYNQMHIAIIYGERDMQLYNAAVADLNKANEYFNNFIQFRNHFFKPAIPDAALALMLQPIADLINAAFKKTESMGLGIENFQYNTEQLRQRLHALNKKLDEQNNFLARYLAASVAEREKMFYE